MSKRNKSKGQAPRKTPKMDPQARERAVEAALKSSYDSIQRGDSVKAEEGLRKAFQKLGRHPRLFANLVAAIEHQGRPEDAERAARAAVETYPEDAKLRNMLAAVQKFQGRFDEAQAGFRQAVELDPQYPSAWRNLAGLKKFSDQDDPDIAAMRQLLEKLGPKHEGRALLYFSLAGAYDQIGEIDLAWEHYERGNRNWRSRTRFNVDGLKATIDEVIECFPAEWVNRGPVDQASEAAPVLIVGMPRSGSTLIEQVLSSHSAFHGIGEYPELPRTLALHAKDPKFRTRTLAALGDADIATVGRVYNKLLSKRSHGPERIVDKYLTNYLHLGLLHRAVPGARIVHATRGTMDNVFACYKILFSSNVPYAYDLDEAAEALHQSYRLMDHWKSAMPDAIHEVKYEDVVSDLEGESKKLLGFLGHEWEEGCANFHTSQRPVNSASASQVRQPLYGSSVEAWRRYEKHLAPAAARIEAASPHGRNGA